MLGCDWLPDLLEYDNMYPNLEIYDNAVYNIFKRDFIDSSPTFKGLDVKIKFRPYHENREESYFHITSNDYYHEDNRNIDIKRCERIKWLRKFIENSDCNKNTCLECSGMKVWSTLYKKNRLRIKIMLEEERYLVVLEKRENFYLLITAYYIDPNHRLRALVKEFNKTKSASEETQSTTPSTLA